MEEQSPQPIRPHSYSICNYPNPFNPETNIRFELPKSGHVNLSVFNSLGECTALLIDENLNAGLYLKRFNAIGLPGGVYFYRLIVDGRSCASGKMILLK